MRRRNGAASATARISSSAHRAGCAIISSAARSISRRCTTVVLDEADEMLDMGFREELEEILDATPDRPPHIAVLGDPAAPDRHPGQALPARCPAHLDRRRRSRPRRYRLPGGDGLAVGNRKCRGQPAALSRGGNGDAVLRHARQCPPLARHLAGARLCRGRACRASTRRRSATRRCRRCATGARGFASRPTSPRAASTCRA